MELVKIKSPKILVIDDDNQIRRFLLEIFRERYECWEVGSAEEALLVLAQEAFDLVISDINMLELVPHVHSISTDSVVLMISAQNNLETAIEALRAGAFDYILKPFNVRHVEAVVERALKQSSLLKEKRRYKDQLEKLLTERTAEVNRLAYETIRSIRSALHPPFDLDGQELFATTSVGRASSRVTAEKAKAR